MNPMISTVPNKVESRQAELVNAFNEVESRQTCLFPCNKEKSEPILQQNNLFN